MEHKPVVIGVVGHPASGKDTVADYLVTRGFAKISGGDIIREQMTALGLPVDRASVSEFARQMRLKKGNSYPVDDIVDKILGNTVVAGMRNTEEVKLLRSKLGDTFRLIAVETPLEIRYKRAQDRGRIGDHISFEQFKAEDEHERSSQSGSHEVDAVIAAADFAVENSGTLEDLYRKVDSFLS